jgi:hypothetical protein
VLTAIEIERRLPVWYALSELFLDTELQPEDYRRIAGCLSLSGFERTELQAILENEVAPAFVFNRLDVAGEWCSWGAEEVREIMLEFFQSGGGQPSLPWLKRRRYRRHVARDWSKIEPLLHDPSAC